MPNTPASLARVEANRENARRSTGPKTEEGKAASRANGTKHGLAGAGIGLPPDVAVEVERRRLGFEADFRPTDAIEAEFVRQMALASWRSETLALRTLAHDRAAACARAATWHDDRRLAAEALARTLADDPATAVRALHRTSEGCELMAERWRLLGNGLLDDRCTWTDADAAHALDLLGSPPALRHHDGWTDLIAGSRARADDAEAVADLRALVAEQVEELEARAKSLWEESERYELGELQAGVAIDSGPDGRRLRRYAAEADRLFWRAWNALAASRKAAGLSLRSAAPPSTPCAAGCLDEPKPTAPDAIPAPAKAKPEPVLAAPIADKAKPAPAPGPTPTGDWLADLAGPGPLAPIGPGRKVGLVDLVPAGRGRGRR